MGKEGNMMRKTMEKRRDFDTKKNGKAMENLSRTLGKLIKTRGEIGGKNEGEGKMMPSKIEAPMWDHYRVKHA